MLLLLNEGVIRSGQHVSGAFERTLNDPRFEKIVNAGAKPILLTRLACMAQVKSNPTGFYGAATGEAGLDPVEEFMTSDWLEDLEGKGLAGAPAPAADRSRRPEQQISLLTHM